MWKDTFETHTLSFISGFLIWMTVPLREQNEDDSDGEWEIRRGAFDAIHEMQDEFDDE